MVHYGEITSVGSKIVFDMIYRGNTRENILNFIKQWLIEKTTIACTCEEQRDDIVCNALSRYEMILKSKGNYN